MALDSARGAVFITYSVAWTVVVAQCESFGVTGSKYGTECVAIDAPQRLAHDISRAQCRSVRDAGSHFRSERLAK